MRTCVHRGGGEGEEYLHCNGDLLILIKRPTYVVKETYLCCKRDLLILIKRPAYVVKNTYLCCKRDLLEL